MSKNKIALYSCGGCGLNIGSYFETYRGQSKEGFAQINPVYIDTSHSNVSDKLPNDSVYHVEGLNGSGKVRAEHHESIGERILDVLRIHPTGDLNVVLSSGSGGSGSVIAPLLVSELLKRDVPTIVIIVGSTDSKIELVNTIRTLKSYEAIAKANKSPVVALYYENSSQYQRKKVDADIHTAIDWLSALFSGQNKELDATDLKNWLNYTKVTGFGASLTNLEFFTKTITLDKAFSVITVATLGCDDGDTAPGTPVEYQTVGYMPESVRAQISLDTPLHAVVLDGVFNQIHKRLDDTMRQLNEISQARVNKQSILSDKDKPTDTGLVL